LPGLSSNGRLIPKPLLKVSKRGEWRDWLRRHHKSAKEIWLVFNKKHTGRPRISYNDAVEEALAFGWIDSTVRKVDKARYAQRFTPRRRGSPYSQSNLERLRAMARRGKVTKAVLASLGDLLPPEALRVPPDLLAAVKTDAETWRNFRAFSDSYKRIRIGYIEGARDRPAEFVKRLRHFLEMTKKNRLFGFGGIEKYY
jgi:uncharacterized protein YdeI (YjbR/CyaY-like superfamily)